MIPSAQRDCAVLTFSEMGRPKRSSSLDIVLRHAPLRPVVLSGGAVKQ